MASSLAPRIQAFKAGADLRALQYTIVKLSALDTVIGSGANEKAEGILMNAPNIGETAEVAVAGGALLKVASTVGIGLSFASGAAGVGAAATSGQWALGVFQDAGVSGDIVPVIIDRHTAGAV